MVMYGTWNIVIGMNRNVNVFENLELESNVNLEFCKFWHGNKYVYCINYVFGLLGLMKSNEWLMGFVWVCWWVN